MNICNSPTILISPRAEWERQPLYNAIKMIDFNCCEFNFSTFTSNLPRDQDNLFLMPINPKLVLDLIHD